MTGTDSSDSTSTLFVRPRAFEARVSAIFAASFVTMGVHLPFFPLWLDTHGFDAAQIATILSVPMFLRVVTTPAIAALADRSGERANVLIAVCAAALGVSLLYFLPQTYLLTLVASLAFSIFLAPQVPLADALALSGVRRFASNYAGMRVWGSISFLLVNLACGYAIARTGAGVVPVLLTVGLALTVVATLVAPRLGPPRRPSPLSAAELSKVGTLRDRRFMGMVIGYGLVTGSHGFLYAFVSIYWLSLGMSGTTVGMLWAVSVVAEVVLFMLSKRLFGNATATALLLTGAVVATVRWLLFPLVWPSGAGLPGFVAIQILHAFSFGITLLGVQKLITESVAEERMGAAQGLAYFASGLGMAAVTLVSGYLYDGFGAGGFVAMAAVTTVGAILMLGAARLRSTP